MTLRQRVCELSVDNPLLRLRLRKGNAYRLSNLLLLAAFMSIGASQVLRCTIFFYSRWVLTHMPQDLPFGAPKKGFLIDEVFDLGVWEGTALVVIMAAHSVILASAMCQAIYEWVTALFPATESAPLLADDLRVLPIKEGQIIVAIHDYAYLKAAGIIVLCCSLLILPVRIGGLYTIIPQEVVIPLSFLGMRGRVFGSHPDLVIALRTCLWWGITFATHRGALVVRTGGWRELFRSKLAAGAIAWLGIMLHLFTRDIPDLEYPAVYSGMSFILPLVGALLTPIHLVRDATRD